MDKLKGDCQVDDSQIVELYWKKDQEAIAVSEKKYGAYCRTIAKNILLSQEDAEECVNDTWLCTWNAIPPQRPKSLKLFLARITRNLAINYWNKRKAAKRGGQEIVLVLDELAECLRNETDIEGEILIQELNSFICAFVKGLPARDKKIFVLRYFYTEPISKIAECCLASENCVKVVLSRTRKKLREQLIREGLVNE